MIENFKIDIPFTHGITIYSHVKSSHEKLQMIQTEKDICEQQFRHSFTIMIILL